MRRISKIWATILTICMTFLMFGEMINVNEVMAAGIETIDLRTLTNDATGNGWSYSSSSQIVTITSGDVKITTGGAVISDKRIVVNGDKAVALEVNITLENCVIDRTSTSNSPFTIERTNTSDVNINLVRTNTFTGGSGYSGLNKADYAVLTIEGSGKLTAIGLSAPGIGKRDGSTQNIVINNGIIVAEGGFGAAGIGSNKGFSVYNITINGGDITAIGGDFGAGIGTGNSVYKETPEANNIVINGGVVKAQGGFAASGIGAGLYGANGSYSNTAENIVINGGTVVATGNSNGAGIGGGITKGITINGGNITAVGGDEGGAGIGSSREHAVSDINISGGTIDATAGSNSDISGKAIGPGYNGSFTGSNTVTGGTIVTHGTTAFDKIYITGGSINTTGTEVTCKGPNGEVLTEHVFDGFTANEKIDSSLLCMEDYDYTLNDVYADADGKIYLYLPENAILELVKLDFYIDDELVDSQLVPVGGTTYGVDIDYGSRELIGWFVDPQFSIEFEFGLSPVSQNMSLYARFTDSVVPDVHTHIYSNPCDPDCDICGELRTPSEHKYDNDCDPSCNYCGDLRTPSAHVYDNDCDAICNVCGLVRTPSVHVYDNDCDTTCNICGDKRITTHKYDSVCDPECNVCGAKRVAASHKYDSDCDDTCDLCGYVRSGVVHQYDNDCDAICNVCGAVRTPSVHKYDNDCDTTCNVCGEIRTVSAHVYDNNCDVNCNVCGYVRVVNGHVYDGDCDAICNVCGEERTASSHTYDNDCDTTCDVCGIVRNTAHKYDNDCDAECNICGAKRTTTHKYDNNCDATCNVCGAVRTPSNHVYTTVCDTDCNVCGAVRTVKHVYDNDYDATCNVCGATRAVPTNPVIKPTQTPVPTTAPATPVPTAKPTQAPVQTPVPTPLPNVDENGVAAFAERLYTTCLGRAAEPSGKDYWVSQLKSGKTGREVAYGFFFSDELKNKNLDDKEFITRLYRTFMDREPDQSGMDYWLKQIAAGKDRKYVFDGFINSTEWANICLKYGILSGGSAKPTYNKPASQPVIDFAVRLYTTCLGRNADQGGVDYWSSELSNMRKSGTEVAYGFFFSSEFKNKNLDDKEFITRLYRTFMGREPDDGGFNYWLNQISNGSTREQVFYGFAGSKEFAGICSNAGILP